MAICQTKKSISNSLTSEMSKLPARSEWNSTIKGTGPHINSRCY